MACSLEALPLLYALVLVLLHATCPPARACARALAILPASRSCRTVLLPSMLSRPCVLSLSCAHAVALPHTLSHSHHLARSLPRTLALPLLLSLAIVLPRALTPVFPPGLGTVPLACPCCRAVTPLCTVAPPLPHAHAVSCAHAFAVSQAFTVSHARAHHVTPSRRCPRAPLLPPSHFRARARTIAHAAL
ncbi:hypothetical protein EVG20_g11179 [Dentipellis fragilis]|uniref:Uncharacterized protein n=1 Tax=Dentipellis fragilis TaxID=205917 RepID=A0A4Y9XMT3_9AGAM|nr:hypothetical protein EVG20_g11179 [Dentipellis fragilis]